MKFTDEVKTAADKLFNALKKLDGNSALATVENSAATVEAPTAPAATATPEPTAEPAQVPVNDEAKADEIAELRKIIEGLKAELAGVKVNLNSSIEGTANLTEKLAIILNAPAKGAITEVKNSRPAEAPKEDFKGWAEAIDAKLGITKPTNK